MSSDLRLDPSDPLNLLLHSDQDDSDNTSPPDWSNLTAALWSNPPASELDNTSTKPMYSDILDYSTTDHLADLSMNMDIHSFGIEPNMLHFDPTKFQQSYSSLQYPYFSGSTDDILSNQFPFSFQAALDYIPPPDSASSSSLSSRSPSISSASPQLSSPDTRHLSVASNPTTPVTPDAQPTKSSAPASSVSQPAHQETAEELAQRVRQMAGVMLAVPMTAQLAGQATTAPLTPVQTKLPIPRLPRPNSRNVKPSSPTSSSFGGSSSADSTPPPSTPPPSIDQMITSAPPIQMQMTGPPAGAAALTATSTLHSSSRPKTSHTTIERRYRTNLNARIQSLRMAVPALRVLEDRDSSDGKKIKRALKGGITVQGVPGATGIMTPGEDGTVIDVIDERGYVDGVKVARKCSKANVLGKAVEYIKVLKRREHRLRAEHAGLKTLISGLVGGPALLREWEREWKERFGGEEKDELGADEIANNDAEDEDSDDEDEDEEGETGRKRKRGKVASPAGNGGAKKDKKSPGAPQQTSENATTADAPAKRKRGRPRKVPVPIPPSNIAPQHPSASQDVNMLATPQQQPYQSTGAPQQYLLATFALFSFFNSPLTSSVVLNPHPPLAYAPEIVAGLTPEHQVPHLGGAYGARNWAFGEYAQVFQLAVSVLVLYSMIMSWLKVLPKRGEGNRSWLSSVLGIRSKVLELKPGGHKSHDWLHIGGQIILKGSPVKSRVVSLYTCARVYQAVLAAKPAASLSDLCTLSLVMHRTGPSVVNPLLRARARAIWNQAKTRCGSLLRKPGKHVAIHERLVLESMDADEAASLSSDVTVAQIGFDTSQAPSPLQLLGGAVIRERMKKHLGLAFVKIEDRQKTFSAAAELGGRLAELGKIAERLCRLIADDGGRVLSVSSDLVESLASNDDEDEVAALILALVLYQRMFHPHDKGEWTMLGSSSLSSLGRSTIVGDPVLLLKKTLGNRVFEQGMLRRFGRRSRRCC
ncbi:hypothetical protein F5887DRAFT_1076283 [Amanita rubescens]|nr:hypothetical protein F5887DRAFT_1076283 [Amanita rubescens]